ncbi:kinase-like domain-containing protein [Phlyctochytrium arcticum]|nr:kinase-like domain-containing protein [Phlyctochytrium arcticum]
MPDHYQYTPLRTLLTTSTGHVQLARRRRSAPPKSREEVVCLKTVLLGGLAPEDRQRAMREATILDRLPPHPHIVAFREAWMSNGNLFIVSSYAEGGDLDAYIKARKGNFLSESKIWDWAGELISALRHLKLYGVLHRDVKSKNIFITSTSHLILGDFGISRVLPSSSLSRAPEILDAPEEEENNDMMAQTPVGTPFYLSPEVASGVKYGFKTDIWGLGCVLYELATLSHAFDAPSLKALIPQILRGDPSRPIPSHFSTPFKAFVRKLLTVDVVERPGIEELEHDGKGWRVRESSTMMTRRVGVEQQRGKGRPTSVGVPRRTVPASPKEQPKRPASWFPSPSCRAVPPETLPPSLKEKPKRPASWILPSLAAPACRAVPPEYVVGLVSSPALQRERPGRPTNMESDTTERKSPYPVRSQAPSPRERPMRTGPLPLRRAATHKVRNVVDRQKEAKHTSLSQLYPPIQSDHVVVPPSPKMTCIAPPRTASLPKHPLLTSPTRGGIKPHRSSPLLPTPKPTPRDSIFTRIEFARLYIEHQIGLDNFLSLYKTVERSRANGTLGTMKEGHTQRHAVKMVRQLLECEYKAYGNT